LERSLADYFLYIDENVRIIPAAPVPRNLSEVPLVPERFSSRFHYHDEVTSQRIGSHSFNLRCVFGFAKEGVRSDAPSAPSSLTVTNGGVVVLRQERLALPVAGSDGEHDVVGYRPPDPDAAGWEWDRIVNASRSYGTPERLAFYAVVIDFWRGNSPLLPSRMELDVDKDFARKLTRSIYQEFGRALTKIAEDIAERVVDEPHRQRRAIIKLIEGSILVPDRSWHSVMYRRRDVSELAVVDDAAKDIYRRFGMAREILSSGRTRLRSVSELQSEGGVFVTKTVERSGMFRIYRRSLALESWILIDSPTEYVLFRSTTDGNEWNGMLSERQLYESGEVVWREDKKAALNKWLRGDYAVIRDNLFDGVAVAVLPGNLAGAWRRGDAAASTRALVAELCPVRVLLNKRHPIVAALEKFSSTLQPSSDAGRQFKLVLDSLWDGVVEPDRVTVGRGRWTSVRADLGRLLGIDLTEFTYDSLMSRK
jgi:hypothetical protein